MDPESNRKEPKREQESTLGGVGFLRLASVNWLCRIGLTFPPAMYTNNVFNMLSSLSRVSPVSRYFETTRNAEIIDVSMNFSASNKNVWITCCFEITCNGG